MSPTESPLITAVPAPGPMTKRPFLCAASFSCSSSSSLMSLKMKRFMSLAIAAAASAAAYSPGSEMMHKLASGMASFALETVLYSTSAAGLSEALLLPEANSLTRLSAAFIMFSSSQSRETMRSLGPAFAADAVRPPNSPTTVLFMSVAMTATALCTPGSFMSSLDTDKISIESI